MPRLTYLFPISFLHRGKVFSETQKYNIGYSDTTVKFQKVLDTEQKKQMIKNLTLGHKIILFYDLPTKIR